MYLDIFNVVLALTLMDTYLNASRVKRSLAAPFFPDHAHQDRVESWLSDAVAFLRNRDELAKESLPDESRCGKLKVS